MTLAERASRFYDENDDDALFRLAREVWSSLGPPMPNGSGEACRFAMIRARQAGSVDQHLWRARAMCAAVLTGARDTAAGLLLQPFFAATELAMTATGAASHNGHRCARLILEEIKRLIPEGTQSWSRLFGRLYHEKRAYSFLREATPEGRPTHELIGPLREAEAEYLLAVETAGSDKRGLLKLRGGVALVRYLLMMAEPRSVPETAGKPFLEETRTILAAATAAGFRDVAAWAAANVQAMERGDSTGWTPYEVV